MEFKIIPGIVSKSGNTYEISNDFSIRLITKSGNIKTMKIGTNRRIELAGKKYCVHHLSTLAGWPPFPWPDDIRDWYELPFISNTLQYRYRILEDSEVQYLDPYGTLKIVKPYKTNEGYIAVCIDNKQRPLHQIMGMVEKWLPKPNECDDTWTVHHKNNDPTNNHKDNLIWASRPVQSKERRPKEQIYINSCPVIGTAINDIMIDGILIKKGCDTSVFESMSLAGAAVGASQRAISSFLCGSYGNSCGGFIWRVPDSDIHIPGEIFMSVADNLQRELFSSNYGRIKFAFHNGYSKIIMADELISIRAKFEKDVYPRIRIDGSLVRVHRLIVKTFCGKIPDGYIIDHIDDDKHNAALGNLQIFTRSENRMKYELKSYNTSVSSFVDKIYEQIYDTKISAIEYIIENGYPEANLEELEQALKMMELYNIPAALYGRIWIRAGIVDFVKK